MLRVDKIHDRDLETVVSIHKSAFPDFFLTKLGDRFLKLYYKSVQCHGDGVLLGCYDGDLLLGFCAATVYAHGFHRRLIKVNLLAYIREGISLVAIHPVRLKRLLLNLTKKSDSIADFGNYAELLSIGVLNTCQGKGIGKILLNELENYLRMEGASDVSLTTDCLQNTTALNFYQSLGYSVYYRFETYPHREMYRLIKKI